jgi:hypothetical protein
MKIEYILLIVVTFSIIIITTNAQGVITFDFFIRAIPSSGQVYAGEENYTIVITYLKSNYISFPFPNITFSCPRLPSGISCSFYPQNCTLPFPTKQIPIFPISIIPLREGIPFCSSLLTISTSPETKPGTYRILIVGTSDNNLVRVTTYNLRVIAKPSTLPIESKASKEIKYEIYEVRPKLTTDKISYNYGEKINWRAEGVKIGHKYLGIWKLIKKDKSSSEGPGLIRASDWVTANNVVISSSFPAPLILSANDYSHAEFVLISQGIILARVPIQITAKDGTITPLVSFPPDAKLSVLKIEGNKIFWRAENLTSGHWYGILYKINQDYDPKANFYTTQNHFQAKSSVHEGILEVSNVYNNSDLILYKRHPNPYVYEYYAESIIRITLPIESTKTSEQSTKPSEQLNPKVIIENRYTSDIAGAYIQADYSNTFETSLIICNWDVLKQEQTYECIIPSEKEIPSPSKDLPSTKMKFAGRFTLFHPFHEFDFQLDNLEVIAKSNITISVRFIDIRKPGKIIILPPPPKEFNPKVIIENKYNEPQRNYSIVAWYEYYYQGEKISKEWAVCYFSVLEPNKIYECEIPYITSFGGKGKFTGEFSLSNPYVRFNYNLENLELIKQWDTGIRVKYIKITKPGKITILSSSPLPPPNYDLTLGVDSGVKYFDLKFYYYHTGTWEECRGDQTKQVSYTIVDKKEYYLRGDLVATVYYIKIDIPPTPGKRYDDALMEIATDGEVVKDFTRNPPLCQKEDRWIYTVVANNIISRDRPSFSIYKKS